MSAEASATILNGQIQLSGTINMYSAAGLLNQLQPLVRQSDQTLDLSAVVAVDSACLSLILALLRSARAAGHVLKVVAVPPTLASLADLYGVDTLLADCLT